MTRSVRGSWVYFSALSFLLAACGDSGGETTDAASHDDADVLADAGTDADLDANTVEDGGGEASTDDGGPAVLVPSVTTYAFSVRAAPGTDTTTIALTNQGGSASGAVTVSLEGDAAFTLDADTCTGQTLDPSEACEVTVRVSASSPSAPTATLRFAEAGATPIPVALSATFVSPPEISLDTDAHDFGTVLAGSSTPFTVRATNTGGLPTHALVTTLSASAAFSITADACEGQPLDPGEHCDVTVAFAPSAPGDSEGTLSFGHPPAEGHVAVTFEATAVAPASLSVSPSGHVFADTVVGASSITREITVTNEGAVASGALVVTVTGSHAAQFVVSSDTCSGAPLEADDSCTFDVSFVPSGATGTRSASVNVTGAPGGTGVSSVSGRALAPAHLATSDGSQSFGIVDVGSHSATHVLTIHNEGGQAASSLNTTTTGDTGEIEIVSNACTGMLAGEDDCELAVRFTPTRHGASSATVTVTGTPGGSVAFTLGGTGRDYLSLTVTQPFSGNGQGTVLGSGASCPGASCTVMVPRTLANPVVMLTATASASSTFGGWDGDCAFAGSMAACMLTLSGPTTVGASFALKQYEVDLTMVRVADATGTVSSTSTMMGARELECGETCSTSFEHGTVVTLHAHPGKEYFPGGFTGGCVADGGTCTFTVTGETSITGTLTPANRSFVSSARYSLAQLKAAATDMSTEATKVLTGADAICRTLGGADHYQAFVAAVGVSPESRLPSTARGFLRADGRPFRNRVDFAGRTFHPPLVTELGTSVTENGMIWSGMNGLGMPTSTGTCNNWVGTGLYMGGSVFNTGYEWAAWGSASCDTNPSLRVLCLETRYSADVTPPPPPAGARLVFATQGFFDTTSGLAGADALCESEADDAELPGSYRAMLATDTASFASRFMPSAAPVFRPDGVQVATGSVALFSLAFPIAPISSDAFGEPVTGYAWTGNGTPFNPGSDMTTCHAAGTGSWSTAATGVHGSTGSSTNSSQWAGAAWVPCTTAARVYCLAQ